MSVWLRTLSPMSFALALLAASFVVVAPLAVAGELFPAFVLGPGPSTMQSSGLFGRLVLGSIVAPPVETAIFQWAPVRLLQGRLGLPWPLVLVASATLFAASHYYSLGYIAFAFLVGLVLAYGFAVRNRPQDNPFMLVCIVHAIRNAVAPVAQ